MLVGVPPSQVDSRIGQLARACSSISKAVLAPNITIQALGATRANIPREDTVPLPPFDERPPLPFEFPVYADWL